MTDEQKKSLAAKDPRYAAFFGIVPGAVRPAPKIVLPVRQSFPLCDHLEGKGAGGCRFRLCAKGHGGAAGVKPCDSCGPKCPDYDPITPPDPSPVRPPTVIVENGACGIGDGILGLLATAKLKQDRPDLRVVYRLSDGARPWAALFHGYDDLRRKSNAGHERPVKGGLQINVGYRQEMAARIALPRWERYARNIGTSGFAVPPLREPERLKALGAVFAGHVLLCPFSTDHTREWPLTNWLHLEGLLRGVGIPTAVVHSVEARTQEFRGGRIVRQAPEIVAGAMLNAAAVVGCDSGMAHVAGLLGAPTVVIELTTNCRHIFGAYPRAAVLVRPLPAAAFAHLREASCTS